MREANFDGLVGPSHHYAGLSFGNVASTRNARLVSEPKKAALQGMDKAAHLRDLGILQGILPPLRRPRLDTLRALGFTGTDAAVIERAFRSVPHLLSACYSASSMWVANAATFSPSSDTREGRAHFTPANLSSKFHRSLEPKQTASNLKTIFRGSSFVHHESILPQFGDEGAANHSRLAPAHGRPGIEIFTFGGSALQDANFQKPKKFPARQSIEASQVVQTTHGLEEGRALFFQQNPEAIDAGVFHNDVVAVANENVFLFHEKAYHAQAIALERLRNAWSMVSEGIDLHLLEISENEMTLDEAVRTYFFNSQLVTLAPGKMALICPEECKTSESVQALIQRIIQSGLSPIRDVLYFDLRESMQNGGGPACLRFRVVLSDSEIQDIHPGVWLTPEREGLLRAWILKHYRDRLAMDDLRDPQLFAEVIGAYSELEEILGFTVA